MATRFGPFVLDEDLRRLTREGSEVHLTRKAFDLLQLLMADAGRVVKKTQLHQRLWPRTFVSDAALVSLIKELRRALGERTSRTPFIRTSHGVGYAFIARINRDAPRPSDAGEGPFAGSPGPVTVRGGQHPAKRPLSIAVLPFSDMSPERDQEYFCEGIAEELIHALAAIDGLRVSARSASFQFAGRRDIGDVGTRLKVDTVLEGSVRKLGTRLRVTVQLINIGDGYHLWSERYDRELDDVFAVQDEITRAVVAKLRGTLAAEGGGLQAERHTGDLEAYRLYLEGRYY